MRLYDGIYLISWAEVLAVHFISDGELVIAEARLEILFCLEFERHDLYLARPHGMSTSKTENMSMESRTLPRSSPAPPKFIIIYKIATLASLAANPRLIFGESSELRFCYLFAHSRC